MNKGTFLLKITEKWPVKVLSVAAALIISVFYRLNTLENRTFTVPLKVETGNSFIPVSTVDQTVKVTLRGEAAGILPILEEDIEAYIDLKRYAKEGSFRTPVQIRKKGTALGIEPLEISVTPMEIYVSLEEKITKIIPVYPVFSGTVASGFEMTSQTVTPDSVTVEGTRRSVENQKEFNTETIDLENRDRDFTVFVNIINDNPDIIIHGEKMIEYSSVISRIERRSFVPFVEPVETVETAETVEENGDITQ